MAMPAAYQQMVYGGGGYPSMAIPRASAAPQQPWQQAVVQGTYQPPAQQLWTPASYPPAQQARPAQVAAAPAAYHPAQLSMSTQATNPSSMSLSNPGPQFLQATSTTSHGASNPLVPTSAPGGTPPRKRDDTVPAPMKEQVKPKWAPRHSRSRSDGHDTATAEMWAIFMKIDANQNGELSKHEFIDAIANYPMVAKFVLPDVDCRNILTDEHVFETVDETYQEMAAGQPHVTFSDFQSYFRSVRADAAAGEASNEGEMRAIFDMIDINHDGSVSKWELVNVMRQYPEVDKYVRPNHNGAVIHDDWSFDSVDAIFEAMSQGKKRVSYHDFSKYFCRLHATTTAPLRKWPSALATLERPNKRVFIVGPGFGGKVNPAQGRMIEDAGFQVHWCHNVPNPEQQGFPVESYLGEIKTQIDGFQPDIVACASKGGVYAVGLWQMGYWRGPTLLLNAHPSCRRIPEDVPFVLAHGSNDEVYPTERSYLESLIRTGTPNACFLYMTTDSGQLPSGQKSRVGDHHNMESLVTYDVLPRLIDAALCEEGPEVHMIRTWRDRLSEGRLNAEVALGYTLDELRRFWSSAGRRGLDDQKLFEVPRSSEEFQHIATAFRAAPRETPAYNLISPEAWLQKQIIRVERVENGLLLNGSVKPYYDLVCKSFKQQDIEFEPGTHTRWVFHGADPNAIESIITSHVAGFMPVASGSRASTLWGSGTYFARDAQYVSLGGFTGAPAADGTHQMLACLMVTGMPCLGDPRHNGVLPFRQKPHRYNCSVDSLANPEIYISQISGAVYPAYLITFY